MGRKKYRLNIRLSDITLRKLNAICKVDNKRKTTVIEEMIYEKYKKDRRYEDQYYRDIE